MTNENTGHVLLGLSVLLSLSGKTIRPIFERAIRWRAATLRMKSERVIQFHLKFVYVYYWLFLGLCAMFGVLALLGVKLDEPKERDDHVRVHAQPSIVPQVTPPEFALPPANDTPAPR